MGYFQDLYNEALNSLNTSYGQSGAAISGAAGAAEREQNAALNVAASKGGYLNSPLYESLLAKNKSVFTRPKIDALQNLAADRAQAEANLKIQAGNARLQDKQANEQFWQNIIGNAGSLAGMAFKIFGGPAGVAAGAASDVAGGITNQATDIARGAGLARAITN